jgi:ribosomal protein S1
MAGSTDVVADEPLLLLPRRFRQDRAWMKLHKIWRTNTKVKGFIIDKVRGGYSIAIAGFIAYQGRPIARRGRAMALGLDFFGAQKHFFLNCKALN